MKKLVVITESIMHLLRKDMKVVTGEGAEVEAEDVVVDVAVDLPLKDLHKSKLAAGLSTMECNNFHLC